MSKPGAARGAGSAETPIYDPTLLDDLLIGGSLVRQAFLASKMCVARHDTTLVRMSDPQPPILLIRSGFAVRSCTLRNGRRAILDLFVPGGICGLDHAFTRYPVEEISAVGRVAYHALDASNFRKLFSQPQAAFRIVTLVAEARYRVERVAATIGRFDAAARISVLLLDTYDRLRRRELIRVPSFAFPLTQEQIGDYLGLTLVHVNRTLRALREQGLLSITRQMVSIPDPNRLRALVQGLPESAELYDPIPTVDQV